MLLLARASPQAPVRRNCPSTIWETRGVQQGEYPALSAPGTKVPDKPYGFQHSPESQCRSSHAFCPQRSDPFHDLAAAVASFSSSLTLGWNSCLDSSFPPQQTPRALILLEWQCQSSLWMEQVILGPSGWRFSSGKPLAFGFVCTPILPIPSCSCKEARRSLLVLRTPSPSFTCSLLPPPARRERNHLFQGQLFLQQSRSFRAVFPTSELSLLFYYFSPPQQPRSFCQNVLSTCSLLVMLSGFQICYQCHKPMLLIHSQPTQAKFQAAFLKPDPAACLDLKPMPLSRPVCL